MAKHKPGLRKDLSAIFEGSRISKEILARRLPEAISAKNSVGANPKPPIPSELIHPAAEPAIAEPPTTEPLLADWLPSNAGRDKRSRMTGIIRTFKQIPRRIFRPGATPPDKRRLSISKNLLY